jgi:hypothetical protein
MASRQRVDAFEVVYGALIGGLISAFAGIAVFSVFMSDSLASSPPIAAAVTGLVCAAALMVGGMLIADRTPWMGTAFLFGSGFTALWSVALSFSIEQRWFTLLILGAVIVAGLYLGRRRFGLVGTSASLAAPTPSSDVPGGDDE